MSAPPPDGVICVSEDAVIQYLECIQNQMHWCKQACLCKGTYISWDGEYKGSILNSRSHGEGHLHLLYWKSQCWRMERRKCIYMLKDGNMYDCKILSKQCHGFRTHTDPNGKVIHRERWIHGKPVAFEIRKSQLTCCCVSFWILQCWPLYCRTPLTSLLYLFFALPTSQTGLSWQLWGRSRYYDTRMLSLHPSSVLWRTLDCKQGNVPTLSTDLSCCLPSLWKVW